MMGPVEWIRVADLPPPLQALAERDRHGFLILTVASRLSKQERRDALKAVRRSARRVGWLAAAIPLAEVIRRWLFHPVALASVATATAATVIAVAPTPGGPPQPFRPLHRPGDTRIVIARTHRRRYRTPSAVPDPSAQARPTAKRVPHAARPATPSPSPSAMPSPSSPPLPEPTVCATVLVIGTCVTLPAALRGLPVRRRGDSAAALPAAA